MNYIKMRATHSRVKTITFNAEQLNHLRLAVETEMEDIRDVPDPQAYYNELKSLMTLLLPGIWIELYRAVEDDDDNFDETRNYTFKKKEIYEFIEEELEVARANRQLKVRKKDIPKLARKFKWEEEPEFLEFDSGRPHACGYWALRIIGPPELEVAIEESREPG